MRKSLQLELKNLLSSFESAFPSGRIGLLLSFVDCKEPVLALTMLSDWIFDEHIPVNTTQHDAILRVSAALKMPLHYHIFLGRTPPYLDTRTPEQIFAHERLSVEFTRGAQNVIFLDLIRRASEGAPVEVRDILDQLARRIRWWQFWKRF